MRKDPLGQCLPADLLTEMERFELSRRLPDLPHFECGPFSLLGTSPYMLTRYCEFNAIFNFY